MAEAAGGVAGALADVGIAFVEAESQRKAGSQNRDAEKQANLLNYARWVQSRGGDPTGILKAAGLYSPEMLTNAGVVLPGYAGADTEKKLFQDAMAQREAMRTMSPEQQMAATQSIIAGQQPAIDASGRFIGDIYSGALERERLANLTPVEQARVKQAQAQQAAIDLTMRDAVNRIAAQEAMKGYAGAGSFGQNRMLAATLGARQAAAGAMTQAELENEMARQALKESGVDLRLRSVNMPLQRTQQLVDLSMLPQTTLARQSELEWAPFAPFRMQPGSPPQANAITREATPSPIGVGLGGVGNLARIYGTTASQNKIAQEANSQNAWNSTMGGQSWGNWNAANLNPQTRTSLEDYYGGGADATSSFGK